MGLSSARTVALWLGALVVAAVALFPASAGAHAYFPREFSPPSWWWESLGPGGVTQTDSGTAPCVPQESVATPPGETYYTLKWGCERSWGKSNGSHPGDVYGSTTCTGDASHSHTFSGYYTGTDSYQFGCDVYARGTTCSRWVMHNVQHYTIYPDFVVYDDPGWTPSDCRPLLPGWPNRPTDVLEEKECAKAKRLLKQAKRGDDRKKLRKARKTRRKACKIDGEVVGV